MLTAIFGPVQRQILYFGRNASMMALVGHQLSVAGLDAEGFMDENKLMEQLNLGETKLLVIGGGVEDEPRERLKSYCNDHGIMVLEHSGGPQSLPGSITQALG